MKTPPAAAAAGTAPTVPSSALWDLVGEEGKVPKIIGAGYPPALSEGRVVVGLSAGGATAWVASGGTWTATSLNSGPGVASEIDHAGTRIAGWMESPTPAVWVRNGAAWDRIDLATFGGAVGSASGSVTRARSSVQPGTLPDSSVRHCGSSAVPSRYRGSRPRPAHPPGASVRQSHPQHP
jgi:hypothetical protein